MYKCGVNVKDHKNTLSRNKTMNILTGLAKDSLSMQAWSRSAELSSTHDVQPVEAPSNPLSRFNSLLTKQRATFPANTLKNDESCAEVVAVSSSSSVNFLGVLCRFAFETRTTNPEQDVLIHMTSSRLRWIEDNQHLGDIAAMASTRGALHHASM